jgi:3-hydroxyisobutyrate dehydrogenase-like beta-hydroxyacid dehydrogenase
MLRQGREQKTRICRDQLNMSMPVAAAANEQFIAAKEMGHGDDDFAAVYTAVSK